MLIRQLKPDSIYRFKEWSGIKCVENNFAFWNFNPKSDSGRDALIQYLYPENEIIRNAEYPIYYIFKMVSINHPAGYIKLWSFEVGLHVWPTGADVEICKLNDLYRL